MVLICLRLKEPLSTSVCYEECNHLYAVLMALVKPGAYNIYLKEEVISFSPYFWFSKAFK